MQQTSLNMGSIGQKLESARRAKGVSVSEAGQDTKILSKYIEAMEADDFGVLSAPVYAKSFIRMYARYLGIDGQSLVEEYIAQYAPRGRSPLADEVRRKLAAADHVAADAPAEVSNAGKRVFGGVNEVMARLSGSRRAGVWVVSALGLVAALLAVFTLTQCASDEEEVPEPAAGSAARVERQRLPEAQPDLFLVKPGKVEVGQP